MSFAAVIMLYMIGVKPEFLKERQVFVPESMRNTILTMCTDIINENDKEHVSILRATKKFSIPVPEIFNFISCINDCIVTSPVTITALYY